MMSKQMPRIQLSAPAWFKRAALHLCILLGAISIAIESAIEKAPQTVVVEEVAVSSDTLLKEAISATQKKPSVLKKESKEQVVSVESFSDMKKLNLSMRSQQLLNSLASDKLALWSVFSHLSTYSELVEILKSPIKAYERETLRSSSFGIASGFDQIVYRIHLESGGTSLVVAEVKGESIGVSLYRAPEDILKSYQVQRFKDGVWMESHELLRAQVEEELLQTKRGSAVVLSASVGL